MEPGLRIHPFALDGDQTAARVGRSDADLDRLAGLVARLGQRQRQLGIAFQRARQVGCAGNGEIHLVQHRAGRIAQLEHETARLVGRQREGLRRRGQLQGRGGAVVAPFARDIFVQAGVLSGQHGHIALFDDHCAHAGHCTRLAVRPDRQQLHAALGIALDITQVVHRLDSDQEGIGRHQGARLRGDIAPAAGLEGACKEVQLVGRLCIFRQVQREHRLAGNVGGLVAQQFVVAFLGPLRIVETVIRIRRESGEGRAQHQRALDLALLRGRAEQVLGCHRYRQFVGRDPAVRRQRRQRGAHAHRVGRKFAHLHGGLADGGAGVVAPDQGQRRLPSAAGRAVLRRELERLEAGEVQRDALAPRDAAGRVRQHHLQWQASQGLRPVRRAHDITQVDGVAGPVQAAIGEHEGLERAGFQLVRLAANIEARVVQRAAVVVQRQETQVVATRDGQHHRLFLALEARQARHVRTAVRIGVGLGQRLAVAGDRPHLRAGDRLARRQ